MDKKVVQTRNRIVKALRAENSRYLHWFPNRRRVPPVKTNAFTDVANRDMSMDECVTRLMLDRRYIGWTALKLLNVELFVQQMSILRTLWTKPFAMLIATRGGSKSFTLAVYCVLRALFDQGVKIVIVGAGLRQAKLVFNYIENLWDNSPMLRDIAGGGKKSGPRSSVDRCYFTLGASQVVALPMGDGTKIRGERANVVIADEFASIPSDIFDVVVRGFAATARSPVEEARREAMGRALGPAVSDDMREQLLGPSSAGNQIIYSGTAYYAFNHFARRFELWREIIRSKGDPGRVAELFGGETGVPDGFDWRDYAIIRIPYTHVPPGLLDKRQLAHAKATLPKSIFKMEFGATFVSDSDGFFPRSLIESCTVSESKPIETPDGPAAFVPLMHGQRGRQYVMGIDPAAERDKLAITILEGWPHHIRVVHSWAVNRKEFDRRKRAGMVGARDYYAYCCAKIRELVSYFAPVRIEMDSQGGGPAIAEMLRNADLIDKSKGERPIYEVIDHSAPRPTDGEADGPHILHLVKQSNEWNAHTNLFLRQAFETKSLLFPALDTVRMQAALEIERAKGIVVDTFEDCVLSIEELKNELCTIQMQQTSTGKERFDVPRQVSDKVLEGRVRRGRLHKDRYSSLMLAYRYLRDTISAPVPSIDYDDVAGNVSVVRGDPGEGLYRGAGVGRMRNIDWARGEPSVGAVKRGERVR